MQMLDAVINLKDNFSDTLKTVEKNVGEFQRTYKKTGRDIQRTGKSIQGVGSAMTKSFTAPIIAATTASIKAFADLEQSTGGIETLFKDNADTVKKYANEAYKTAGVSANSYMENVTSFSASLLNSMGGDTEAAARVAHVAMLDMGDNANKMGTDMRDIQNAYQGFAKENYTMLDNLKLGYAGTKGGMEELLADAQKLTGVKYDISNLDDVFMAIHAIQEELGITGTTAQEAEETISGSFGMMKASVENLLGGLASADADVGQLIDNVVDSFGYLSKNIIEAVKRTWDNLPLTQFQKTLGAIVVGAGPALFVIGKLTTGIGTMVNEFGFLAGRIGKGGFLKAIFTPGVKVALVLAAIAGAAILVYKNWDKIKPTIDTVRDSVTEFAEKNSEKIEWIKDTFSSLAGTIREKAQEIMEKFEPLKESFGSLFASLKELFDLVMPFLLPILAFIGGVFVAQIILKFQTMLNIVVAVIEGIMGVLEGLITIMSGVIEFVIGVFTGDWERAWNGVETIFGGVVQTLDSIWETFVGFVTAPVNAVVDILDSAFHDKVSGIKEAWGSVKDFLKNPIKGTVNLAKKGWNAVKGIGNNYKGTDNWRGGPTWVHEKGPEIIDLPSGSRVYPHSKSLDMARNEGRAESQSSGGVKVSVSGNTFHVRKESDIDAIATALARKIAEAGLNTA